MGCRSLSDRVTFVRPMVLAGRVVSDDVLNEGREHYVQNCYACHGMAGNGTGPASHYYRPPPRDLTRGLYKFGGVVDGLPHDEDFVRIVRLGLHGTPMLAWDIPDAELYPIIQYVKSLSPVWQEAELGQQIPVDTDTWEGNEREAVARGRQVYHGLATCQQCHPAYATKQEMYEASQAVGNRPIVEFRRLPFQPETKESQYEANGKKMMIMPPDFLFNEVRSGDDVKDLYRVISSASRARRCPPGMALCRPPTCGPWPTMCSSCARCAARLARRRCATLWPARPSSSPQRRPSPPRNDRPQRPKPQRPKPQCPKRCPS
jgi:mono/diheme cytochrome c family protein